MGLDGQDLNVLVEHDVQVAQLVFVSLEAGGEQLVERRLAHEEVEVADVGLEPGEHHRGAAEDDDVVTHVLGEHGVGPVEQQVELGHHAAPDECFEATAGDGSVQSSPAK